MVNFLREPLALGVSDQPIYTSFVTDYISANAPDGLEGRLIVQDMNDVVLDEYRGYYHPDNGKVQFDIQSAFVGLEPPLPVDVAMTTLDSAYYELQQSSIVYKVRAHDKFRIVPYKSDDQVKMQFLAIWGDTKVDLYYNQKTNSYFHVAHNYPLGYIKTVTTEQPDFLYFLTTIILQNCNIQVTVFMDDGTSFQYLAYETVTVPHNRMVCFPCGFKQMNIAAEVKARYAFDVAVKGYHYALMSPPQFDANNAPLPRYMLLSKSFEVDGRFPDETMYIAYDNGVGGLETQYFPRYQKRKTAEKTTIDKMVFDDAHKRSGEKEDINVKVHDRVNLKSLLLPRADLENLQRLTHAHAWLITAEGFERIYSDSNSIDAPASHHDSGFFSFAYKKFL
jgi:hypothetical protein